VKALTPRTRAFVAAVRAFLSGFLGVGAAPGACTAHRCQRQDRPSSPTPATIRAQLAARSARRGSCC